MHSSSSHQQSYSLVETNFDSYLRASRRSFFLLLTFDFTFVGLIWLIYCTTKGYSLKEAYENEIENYNINDSLFDVVVVALLRSIILCVFYVGCKMSHWLPITLVTFSSSSFLIAKVILFAMKGSHKIITDYLILIISFMIVWIQTWYLEVKIFTVIKSHEQNERSSILDVNGAGPTSINNVTERRSYYGSMRNSKGILSEIGSFYSPMDSPGRSDDEDEEESNIRKVDSRLDMTKQKEYEIVASQLLNEVLNIYSNNTGWKVTKEHMDQELNMKIVVTAKSFNKIGKVFKVETVLPFSDQLMLKVIRDDIPNYTKWNVTIKMAKVLEVFNESLRIMYICVKEQAGGLVTSRDFVNLSKYCFYENKHILAARHCPSYEYTPSEPIIRAENGPSGYIITPLSDDQCQITCLINVNLKGWLPQYLIDQTLSTVQVEFITDLTKYLHKIKQDGQIVDS